MAASVPVWVRMRPALPHEEDDGLIELERGAGGGPDAVGGRILRAQTGAPARDRDEVRTRVSECASKQAQAF